MKTFAVLLLCVSLALGGCSILGKDDPPICDGHHRRPANANGSVLDGAAPPLTPAKLSSTTAFFASCA